MVDNKDSKKRRRADVLIEGAIEKMEDKIEKEVEKAAKKFGLPQSKFKLRTDLFERPQGDQLRLL